MEAQPTCDGCGKAANSVTGKVTKAGLLICPECREERARQQRMMEQARTMIPGAIAIAGYLGPLSMAGDDSACGLAAAHANDGIRKDAWCRCRPQTRKYAVYYRNITTGAHGWMCCKCRGITQTG